jgi:hypothetical protein
MFILDLPRLQCKRKYNQILKQSIIQPAVSHSPFRFTLPSSKFSSQTLFNIILIELRAEQSRTQIPAGLRHFFLLQNLLERPWSKPASCAIRTGFYPETKQPGREVPHALPSSTDVKDEWSYSLLPLYGFKAWTGTIWPLPLPLPHTSNTKLNSLTNIIDVKLVSCIHKFVFIFLVF